jgi:hypothetical protein
VPHFFTFKTFEKDQNPGVGQENKKKTDTSVKNEDEKDV